MGHGSDSGSTGGGCGSNPGNSSGDGGSIRGSQDFGGGSRSGTGSGSGEDSDGHGGAVRGGCQLPSCPRIPPPPPLPRPRLRPPICATCQRPDLHVAVDTSSRCRGLAALSHRQIVFVPRRRTGARHVAHTDDHPDADAGGCADADCCAAAVVKGCVDADAGGCVHV